MSETTAAQDTSTPLPNPPPRRLSTLEAAEEAIPAAESALRDAESALRAARLAIGTHAGRADMYAAQAATADSIEAGSQLQRQAEQERTAAAAAAGMVEERRKVYEQARERLTAARREPGRLVRRAHSLTDDAARAEQLRIRRLNEIDNLKRRAREFEERIRDCRSSLEIILGERPLPPLPPPEDR